MIVLAIEAATSTGSVAVLRDGAVLAECETAMRGERTERLMPAVADTLRSAGVVPDDVARVVCGAGPGSFTSLRVAGAIAKGLARTAGATLHPISSLTLIVAGAAPALTPGRYVAVLDAMRGDVFAAVYVANDQTVGDIVGTTLLPRGALEAFAREHSAHLIGPGETPARAPHARGAAALGTQLPWPPPADLAAWEPEYGRLAEAQVRWEAAHGRALTP